ncbi:hypothetical protein RI129_002565 [Pyrocoelia pectoralis]|uniref:Sm domain-containing protein n=1 Tax=Pyrocoelia pectoralis TaxID=417401 RepID=A0AAN7VN68_9COLE
MQRVTKKEQFHFFNSLTGLVKGLENEYTIIDLRNEECISGKIKYVDGFMNIDLEDVIFYNSRGRLIRYVHIPKHLSSVEVYEKFLNGLKMVKPKKPTHTYKRVRALKYHKQTVADAFAKT